MTKKQRKAKRFRKAFVKAFRRRWLGTRESRILALEQRLLAIEQVHRAATL